MQDMVVKLDELGQPAWIGLMVVSFILFWPIGLGVLAFLLWSGRMGCGWNRSERSAWKSRMRGGVYDAMNAWGGPSGSQGSGPGFGARSSGNHAFDEYRTETLKRLEEEQRAFRDFLDKLRFAKDRSEFDQFMSDRKNRPQTPPDTGAPAQN